MDAHISRRGPDPLTPSVAGMTTQHIETLIIGAGQAGLSTGYHLQRLGRPFLIVDAQRARRRQLAAAVGHAAALHARQVRRTARPAVPGAPLALPAEGRGGRLPGAVRAALRPPGADEHPRRPTRGPAGRRLSSPTLGDDTITCDNVVVATGTFGRTPNVPEFAADLDPSILQLHSSEYRRPAQLQPGPVLVVGASHSGQRHRLRGRAEHPPTILCGRDCGQIPVRSSPAGRTRVLPVMRVRVPARAHPAYADGPQGDGRGPLPRRPDAPRQAGGPRRAAACERVRPGSTGVRDGRPVLDDGTVVDVDQRRVVHRLPAGLRLDRRCRSSASDGWPAGVPRRRRRARPGCSSAASASSTRSARWCSPASAATPSTSPAGSTRASATQPARGRCLTGGGRAPPARILRRRGVRDGRGRRPGSGPGGLRAPRVGRGLRRALRRRRRRARPPTTSPGWRPRRTCWAATTTASRPCSAPTRSTSTAGETLAAVRCGVLARLGPAHQR